MKHYLFQIFVVSCLTTCVFLLSKEQDKSPAFDPEVFIDTIVDAGFDLSSTDSDPTMLQQRLIVATTDINAHFARSVIRNLILLDRQSHTQPIDLYLRTEGGWGPDAFAVVDIMQSIQAPVNVHALGGTHSSGCIILAGATGDRIVYPNTIVGFHTPREDDDDIFGERYIRFWKKYTQLPQSWLQRRDDEMVYFSPEDALRYKVADKIQIATAKTK